MKTDMMLACHKHTMKTDYVYNGREQGCLKPVCHYQNRFSTWTVMVASVGSPAVDPGSGKTGPDATLVFAGQRIRQ